MPSADFNDTTHVTSSFDDGTIHTTHSIDTLRAIDVGVTLHVVVGATQKCFASYAFSVHRDAIYQRFSLLWNENLIRSCINLDLFFLFRNVNRLRLGFRYCFCLRQIYLSLWYNSDKSLPFHRTIRPPSKCPRVLLDFISCSVFQRKTSLFFYFSLAERHAKSSWRSVKRGA